MLITWLNLPATVSMPGTMDARAVSPPAGAAVAAVAAGLPMLGPGRLAQDALRIRAPSQKKSFRLRVH
jgi:hypothetical protein